MISPATRIGLLLFCAAAIPSCGGSPPEPAAASGNTTPSGNDGNPSVSQGGRFVVFESAMPGEMSQAVVVDRVNATSSVVGVPDTTGDISNAVLTPDGRFVAFESQLVGSRIRQVFLRD